ncbi:MAG: hypothetical protein L0216_06540 [Planctomycetales bacterium]|nr:hypothetical protein [Planctomycetales bacterium]
MSLTIVSDAAIVAVCAEAGVTEILTEDRDLSRFPSLKARRLTAARS